MNLNTTAICKSQPIIYTPRLYVDRLAHWRYSLVDPQLEIQALAAVPKDCLNYTS